MPRHPRAPPPPKSDLRLFCPAGSGLGGGAGAGRFRPPPALPPAAAAAAAPAAGDADGARPPPPDAPAPPAAGAAGGAAAAAAGSEDPFGFVLKKLVISRAVRCGLARSVAASLARTKGGRAGALRAAAPTSSLSAASASAGAMCSVTAVWSLYRGGM